MATPSWVTEMKADVNRTWITPDTCFRRMFCGSDTCKTCIAKTCTKKIN